MDRAKWGRYIDHVLQKAIPAVVVERGGATKYWKFSKSFLNKNGSFRSHQFWVKSMANETILSDQNFDFHVKFLPRLPDSIPFVTLALLLNQKLEY